MNAVIFFHWLVLNDGFTSVPLQLSEVTVGHHTVAMGTRRKQEGNFSWAPNSDTLLRLRQTRLSCTSSVKAGVRSCCLFNFLTSHKSGQSTPLFFTLPLLLSFSYVETYFHTYPCGCLLSHIFFVCITPLRGSLTQYIFLLSGTAKHRCNPVCVCASETVFVISALQLLWPSVTIAPTLSTL